MDPNEIGETLTFKVDKKTQILVSTHKINEPFYANKSKILKGGGIQYFSTKLKKNVKKKTLDLTYAKRIINQFQKKINAI